MPGTLEHKRIRVLAFYRWLGVKIQPKIPAFKPVKALPEAYDDKQLSALFSAAPLRHRLLYTLLLQSGLREGEAASLRYCDLADDAVLVRPHNGFVPKDSEERAIPVPRALIKQLRALPASTEASCYSQTATARTAKISGAISIELPNVQGWTSGNFGCIA